MARLDDRPEFPDDAEGSVHRLNGVEPAVDLRFLPDNGAAAPTAHRDAAAWSPSIDRPPLQTFRLGVHSGPPVAASAPWPGEDDQPDAPPPYQLAPPHVPASPPDAPQLRHDSRRIDTSRFDPTAPQSRPDATAGAPSARDTGALPISPAFVFPEHAADRGHDELRWDIPPLPVQPAASGAESLTADRIIRSRRARPDSGWRRSAYALTRGLVNLGPSQAERERAHLLSLARSHVTWCHRLAVISLKGGVGKTTTTAALGSMLAELRGDRVIAVDANPDRGTLGERVPRDSGATVRHLLQARHQIERYADVRKFTSQAPSRLEVLASAADPGVSLAFSEQDYRDTVATLERFYSLLLTDCGTGLLHSAMAGILHLADSLVVVSSSSLDGARSASATLDWLEAHGFHDLAAEAVVVISSVRPKSGMVDIGLLHDHFAERCREVVRIPYDPHLEAGGIIDLQQMKPGTRAAYLELAAVVGQGLAASY